MQPSHATNAHTPSPLHISLLRETGNIDTNHLDDAALRSYHQRHRSRVTRSGKQFWSALSQKKIINERLILQFLALLNNHSVCPTLSTCFIGFVENAMCQEHGSNESSLPHGS